MNDADTKRTALPAQLPSVPQMAQRANEGHLKALARIARGEPCVGSTEPPSAARGMRVVLSALSRWGCIETCGSITVLTDRGCALAGALVSKGWQVQ